MNIPHPFRASGLAARFTMVMGLAVIPLASPLAAQSQDPSSTIVVEGQREVEDSEVRKQARAITPRTGALGEPLARIQQPVCPGVWGMTPESAQLIIDRIYYNAEQVGLPLNEQAGCRANVIVAFVIDPHAEFAQLREVDHYTVAGLSLWERKRVAEQEGPVLAWNAISTQTRDGQGRTGDPPVFDSTMISRTESGIRTDIELSVVLIDTDAIAGLDGVAVADYVTMRTLARTRPPGEGESTYGTILSLFDQPDGATQRLSSFDLAYLRSLYAGPANRPANIALRGIDTRMEQEQVAID